jgi:chemotaxis protein MotB
MSITSVSTVAQAGNVLPIAGCVSQSEYNLVQQENHQLQAQLAAVQQENKENKIVAPGDMLFPEGSRHPSQSGRGALNQITPRLRNLADTDAKVTVSGYTDDTPIGPELQRQGIRDNLDLS